MSETLPQLTDMQDILDIKDIPYLNDAVWRWSLIGFAGFILALLLFFLVRKLLRKRSSKKVLTPYERAIQDLDHLERSLPKDPETTQRFYFQLSDTFRLYLEDEKKLPAVEATLEELKEMLRSAGLFSKESQKELFWFLDLSEMAKFARWQPPQDEIVRSLEICKKAVIALAPVLDEKGKA